MVKWLKKNKSKSDKSRSTWNSRKYVMTVTDFFHVQSVLGQKNAANNFFDADHRFESNKIGF